MTPPNIERYPLTWPTTWQRTPTLKRMSARFEVSFASARDHLLHELELLGATSIILSTNIPLRRDGLPYANTRSPEDPGVAVYFQLKHKPHVLACDQWNLVKDNLRAIGLHVAALRGMGRWCVGSVEQVFTGYQALPPGKSNNGPHQDWWIVLGVAKDATLTTVRQRYTDKAKDIHPDANGSHERMVELNRAWEEAKKERLR